MSPADTPAQGVAVAAPLSRSAWRLALIAIASGSVLVPLNSTMLAVALPSIMADLQVGAGTVSWLVTAYLATVAITMSASGNAGDRLGHRRMFVVGVGAFAASSLLGAVAWSFPMLAVSRVLQAASGAFITTNSVALVRAISPHDRRGSSFGILEMLVLTSAASGPFLGGILVGGFGWRSLFVMAVPIALISAVITRGTVPEEVPIEPPPFDLAGLGMLSILLLVLLWAISGIRGHGPWTWYAVAALPVLLVMFVARELRAPVPAVDVRLFTIIPFSAAVATVFGATVILHASMILIPILTQNLLRASPAISGLVMFSFFGTSAITAPLGGRLSDSMGRRLPAVAGSAALSAGLAGLWLWTGRVSLIEVAVFLGLIGVGFGLSGTPRQTLAIESVPGHATGMAAGAYFTSRYIGGVIGASLAGVVLGGAVTYPAIAGGFGILTTVGVAVTLISLGLHRVPPE